MRILIICSATQNKISPFITEQAESLMNLGVEYDYFTIKSKGIKGYLKHLPSLKKKIRNYHPDLIHAHYGLSGLLANLQRKVPVITTYHGSDINNDNVFRLSKWAIRLSNHNIFVSQKNADKAKVRKNWSLIPCGVDTNIFVPVEKKKARDKMGLSVSGKYVLFAGAFDNRVKNYPFAQKAIELLKTSVTLIELKGYQRKEVALLMSAVDVCLMTSFTEGSPQFIKEAMACNRPVVTANVGDVAEIIADTEGCYVLQKDIDTFVKAITNALKCERTKGRERIKYLGLDLDTVAHRLVDIYHNISK